MSPLDPWQTVWPAGVALIGVLGLLFRLAGTALPRPGRLWWSSFMALLALRLFALPVFPRHIFDGHEAEYWDLFRGVTMPTRGGTVLYPAMQWGWHGVGLVLPAWSWLPPLLMACLGAASALFVGSMVRSLGTHRAGWIAVGVVGLHAGHMAWSSSAYNVMPPFFWGSAGLALVAWRWRTPGRFTETAFSLKIDGLSALCLVLCTATRLDASILWGLALWLRLGRPGPLAIRVGPLAIWGGALGLAWAAAWPLVFPGEVPGAGERTLSFLLHWDWLAPHAPLDGAAPVLLAGGLALMSLWARPRVGIPLLVLWLGNHFLMATFDDFADRHVLPGLIGCAGLVGIGLDTAWRWRPRPAAAAAVGLAVALVLGVFDMRGLYYLPEAQWRGPEGAPVLSLDDARANCGWIAEDDRVAAVPVRSHFNIIDPVETAELRAPGGCLRWCKDIQDIRWSSRGVRDRALRLEQLFDMVSLGVVVERESGYVCQVLELTPHHSP